MGIDISAGFRVTIWRPYTPVRALTLKDAGSENMTLLGPEAVLQQEAFTFQPKEDVWGGLVDSDAREALSVRFISDFEPVRPPSERGLDRLAAFLVDLREALPKGEWASSGQQLDEDSEQAVRLNPLLAFYSHLAWMYDTFKDTPGASVSVR